MQEKTWRRMLRLKTSFEVRVTGARKTGNRALTGILAVGLLMAGASQGQAQATSSSSTGQATQQTTTPTPPSPRIEDWAGGAGDLRQQV